MNSVEGSDILRHAGGAHLKDAYLVSAAKSIFYRAQQAEGILPVALKIKHRIHHMLKYAGTCYGAVLSHVAYDKCGRARCALPCG